MITRSILEFFVNLTSLWLSWLPRLPEGLFGWINEAVAGFNSAAARVVMLDPIVPFSVLDACVSIVATTFVAALGIEIARIVLSYLTLGGGST